MKEEVKDRWDGSTPQNSSNLNQVESSVQRSTMCHNFATCACKRTFRFGIVFFIFVLLGTGTLLPFNVFLTEKEFYDVRLQVPPYDPFIVDNFMSLFAISFNILWAGFESFTGLSKTSRFVSISHACDAPHISPTAIFLPSASSSSTRNTYRWEFLYCSHWWSHSSCSSQQRPWCVKVFHSLASNP